MRVISHGAMVGFVAVAGILFAGVKLHMMPLPLYTGTAIAFFLVIFALTTLVDRSAYQPQGS